MNTHKTIFLLAVLLFSSETYAQVTSIGIKAGANLFDLYGDDVSTTKLRVTPNAGIFLTYSDENILGITVEGNYIGKGARLDGTIPDGSPEDIKLSYIEVPIYGNLFLMDGNFRPKVLLGPSFAFLINAESDLKDSDEKVDLDDEYSTVDIGAVAGVGFHYQFSGVNWFYFDLRYGIGFSNVSETENDVKNHGFGLNLGVSFPLTY